MNYIIVAHYDECGLISQDLRQTLNQFSNLEFNVVFVSTQLNADQIELLHPQIRVVVRENIGYDFYSYAHGLKIIIDKIKAEDHIFLMNSSFRIHNFLKLHNFFNISTQAKYSRYALLSLTMNHEFKPHCQSFLLRLSPELLKNEAMLQWWLQMQPISERQQVILRYEIGLTQFIQAIGFQVSSVFTPSLRQKIKMMYRYYQGYKKIKKWYKLNPSHYLWDDLLDRYGIIKHEVINKNPNGLDLKTYYSKASF